MYVGTAKGEIYVTQLGGGTQGSNNWLNVSTGLDGSPVQSIITNPNRGSHQAYAVTQRGVYVIADSIVSATNPTPTWVNITGNIHSLAYTIYGQSYNPATDPNTTTYNQAISLTSIMADWRYAIPNDPTNPSAGTHPCFMSAAIRGCISRPTMARRGTFSLTRLTARSCRGAICRMSRSQASACRSATSISTPACPIWLVHTILARLRPLPIQTF